MKLKTFTEESWEKFKKNLSELLNENNTSNGLELKHSFIRWQLPASLSISTNSSTRYTNVGISDSGDTTLLAGDELPKYPDQIKEAIVVSVDTNSGSGKNLDITFNKEFRTPESPNPISWDISITNKGTSSFTVTYFNIEFYWWE